MFDITKTSLVFTWDYSFKIKFMSKPILVLRVEKILSQKMVIEINTIVQEKVINDYICITVADQNSPTILFEVYNADQLTPIAIEELKTLLNLK